MPFQVRTDIPFGNACISSVRDEGGVCTISFTASPHGGPEVLWFCFAVHAAGRGAPRAGQLELVLENVQNLLGGNQPENMRPVCRRAGGDWERLAAGTVRELPDGRRSAAWTTDAPATWLEVAFCYPYGEEQLGELLKDTGDCWRSDVIGVSQAGRPMVRLSNGYGAPGGTEPGVYLIARQHSGETPGSWVMDGFLRAMARAGPRAPLVWAVPFTNVDGVVQGDYGKDNFPYDLNRAWGRPPMRHETLALQGDMNRWKARCRPLLALDLHAPGGSECDGIYAHLLKPEKAPEAKAGSEQWAERLGRALGDEFAAEKFGRVASYPSRWETAHFSDFCWQALKCCGICIETPYSSARGNVLTRERYREAGGRFAQAVLEAVAAG
jgi:hypothetical protein